MRRSAESLRHARAKELFGRAVELAAGLRRAFLDDACSGDPELRREIEDLLRHAEAADDDFLAEPPRLTPMTAAPTRFELTGFRLLERRGEGASGVVFRAEQLRPRREVAVKVLRLDTLAPGMRARFQREAELLARLTHPGIAQVLEAGVADTDAGPLPWIALEFVRGEDLTAYVRRVKPTTDAVLALFVEL